MSSVVDEIEAALKYHGIGIFKGDNGKFGVEEIGIELEVKDAD